MAVSPELFQRLAAKLERAEQHIFNLQILWTEFVEGGAYKLASEYDPNTRERIYKIVDVTPIPTYIPLAIGDAIQNLRSALDHLVYHMVSIGPNPTEKVYSPIGDSAEKFNARLYGLRKLASAA